MHPQTKKITAYIPAHLLREAQHVTGKGITETLKIVLAQLARSKLYNELRNMRGKIKLSIDLKELRKDKNKE